MPLSPEDLQHIAARTLAHYDQHAQSYWEGTHDHDVSQNIAALLKHIPGPPPFDLLDCGCGPGRDLHTFKALGHHAVGLEGAPSAAALGAWAAEIQPRAEESRGAGQGAREARSGPHATSVQHRPAPRISSALRVGPG